MSVSPDIHQFRCTVEGPPYCGHVSKKQRFFTPSQGALLKGLNKKANTWAKCGVDAVESFEGGGEGSTKDLEEFNGI